MVHNQLTADEQSWVIAREYGICNGWRLNFAVDSAGDSFGISGTSVDVSGKLDRLLLSKLRSMSDVIVTSGKTARSEKYKSSKHAPIAIFTISGDLESVPAIDGAQYFTPVVITPFDRLDEVNRSLQDVDVRTFGFESDSPGSMPRSVRDLLHSEGYQSPILESGQTTIRKFISEGILSELCISMSANAGESLSARSLSNAALRQLLGDISDFKLESLFSDGRTLFTRWVRNGVAASR